MSTTLEEFPIGTGVKNSKVSPPPMWWVQTEGQGLGNFTPFFGVLSGVIGSLPP